MLPRPFEGEGSVKGCFSCTVEGDMVFVPQGYPVAGSGVYIYLLNQNEPILNFFVQEETFKRAGGLGLYRTIDTERNDTMFLRRMFGDAITMKEEVFGGGRTTTRNHNPYGRTMRVPF
jgi:hypothetical protein